MASVSVESAGRARTGDLLLAAVAEHGSATHIWFGSDSLKSGPDAAQNLADAIHFLCALHGRHPGIVDHAAGRTIEPVARAWLATAADAMTAERAHLARLSVAAGPIPSTPGGAGSETAILVAARRARHARPIGSQGLRARRRARLRRRLGRDPTLARRRRPEVRPHPPPLPPRRPRNPSRGRRRRRPGRTRRPVRRPAARAPASGAVGSARSAGASAAELLTFVIPAPCHGRERIAPLPLPA